MPDDTEQAFLLGRRLLSHAAVVEERPKYVRGRVAEMFPYIYEAAKKMGIRAISRWLKEEGYAISPPTLSRALAKSDAHLADLVRIVEHPMKLLVEASGLPNYDVFFGPATGEDRLNELRDACLKAYEDRWVPGRAEPTWEELDWKAARAVVAEPCEKLLTQRWFILSEETRKYCKKFFSILPPEAKP